MSIDQVLSWGLTYEALINSLYADILFAKFSFAYFLFLFNCVLHVPPTAKFMEMGPQL